ncbi:MAG: alanine--tRNA ligase-related protein [Candidatus Dojkabacteria bacterium]|nr:alanine--tRNA ligase-related protein [Candidatus Dojkabacteria bacterium]
MTGHELKQKFISFFISKNHVEIPNASLIPENDPSALFTNSGMHPIVRYLMGEPHPLGKRLVNYQRAVRTGDIEDVGSTKRHLTFFEMLGEWSLGDYGKIESLEWTFEFLIDVLKLDPKRLHATVFRGNDKVNADEESIEIWKEIFKKHGIEPTIGDRFEDKGDSPRIIRLTENDNFWPKGRVKGPCGPCSEVYYDLKAGSNADERYFEVVNNVFMTLYQDDEGNFTELKQKNVDVGWGFDRLLMLLQNMDQNGNLDPLATVFETDSFADAKKYLIQLPKSNNTRYLTDKEYQKSIRVILDHIRASVMIIGDGVLPSNKDQGYVLRRLIRRSMTYGYSYLSNNIDPYLEIANIFIDHLGQDKWYKFLIDKRQEIIGILNEELQKFSKLLKLGISELSKVSENTISGELAFRLKEANGIPLEITELIARSQGKTVDVAKFEELMAKHREKSKVAGEKKFVGGLGGYSEKEIMYHTCAHLLLAGLQKLFGKDIHQKGQNITPERLRYDFNFPTQLSNEDLKKLEDWINERIKEKLKVEFVEIDYQEALKLGVEGVFHDKYQQYSKVKVYGIFPGEYSMSELIESGDTAKFVSLEFCGGPHVSNTQEIKGTLKIQKLENVGAGIKRIRAVLE